MAETLKIESMEPTATVKLTRSEVIMICLAFRGSVYSDLYRFFDKLEDELNEL